LCHQYKKGRNGGEATTFPIGVLVGSLNFASTIIVGKAVHFLRCENIQNQRLAAVVFIFLVTYINSVVFAHTSNGLGPRKGILDTNKQLIISVMVQTILPYIAPLVKLSIYKCCLRRMPQQPSVFEIEKKYALFLNMISVCFFYVFSIQMLFIVTCLSFVFQYAVDRLLITYWFEFPPVHDDILNLNFIRILKYTPLNYAPVFTLILLLLALPSNAPYDFTKLF